MIVTQLGIAITGVIAIGITQLGTPRMQRYACLFGLAGQPFWLHAAASTGQWGMVFICSLYTFMWGAGVHKHWIKRKPLPPVAVPHERPLACSMPGICGTCLTMISRIGQCDCTQRRDSHD